MKIKVTKLGKDYKKVFSGLDWMPDNEKYQLELKTDPIECLKILWLLKFPKKKPTRFWEEIEP